MEMSSPEIGFSMLSPRERDFSVICAEVRNLWLVFLGLPDSILATCFFLEAFSADLDYVFCKDLVL